MAWWGYLHCWKLVALWQPRRYLFNDAFGQRVLSGAGNFRLSVQHGRYDMMIGRINVRLDTAKDGFGTGNCNCLSLLFCFHSTKILPHDIKGRLRGLLGLALAPKSTNALAMHT